MARCLDGDRRALVNVRVDFTIPDVAAGQEAAERQTAGGISWPQMALSGIR